MKNKPRFILSAAAALCFSLTGCEKVSINKNDSTPPNIKLEIRKNGGEYQALNQTALNISGGEELDARCVVDDAEGVKSAKIYYSGPTDSCTVNSSVFSGNFQIQPLPTATEQFLDGKDGTTPNKLLLLTKDALRGPFSCNATPNGKGHPFGGKIRLICEGTNWASDYSKSEAEKIVEIKMEQ